ncbi:SGNH/GDSL hydrolase family protein [uncultured Jatrophihabitans sp.]|uniref:SGNH/GDSL hydrolase family protein n=1 Tax=uncultured Jatrophihabitans sp. TaxID=1610747 RepID=UPI0035CBA5AD
MASIRTLSGPRRAVIAAIAVVSAGAAAAIAIGLGVPATAHTQPGNRPVQAGSRYLALGDSVTFGYREAANPPPPDYTDAKNFVGYPEDLGAELKLRVANSSCPGETSASFIDASAPSNGCETAAGGTGPGYRAYPLHVAYSGSQLSYAVNYLRRHRDTRLVSLMIGANDAFLCQETTADKCVSELPTVLGRIGTDVNKILREIRQKAHYGGQLVIVNYYSTNYADPTQRASSQALNSTMDDAAAPYRVRIADGFATFQRAAEQAGGDSCAAGLLTKLTTGGCGVHPSVAGQELLAGAVERAITTA